MNKNINPNAKSFSYILLFNKRKYEPIYTEIDPHNYTLPMYKCIMIPENIVDIAYLLITITI